ncbi:MAG: hypothetical protein LQ346_006339 [Caloplaca aetnensis]|nr:MAG: hypothetical protein LQ346_006339 [Caloplaca aetnensis]
MVFAEHFNSLRQTHPSQCHQSRTALLLVSRKMYAEVQPQYNRESWFDTSGREGSSCCNRNPDDDETPLPQLPYPYVFEVPGPPFKRVFSEGTRARLDEDVSKIFTRFKKDLPEWLFGGPYLRNTRNYWKVRRPQVAGWSFVRFLRKFGAVNAGEIESLRICSAPGSSTRSDALPPTPRILYVTMLEECLERGNVMQWASGQVSRQIFKG